MLREAVAAYRPQSPNDWIEQGFGAWKDRDDIGDAVEWQRRERASWTRPWDFDYEEVRAEFPDLFDAEDDREHERHLAWLAENGMKPGDGNLSPEFLKKKRARKSTETNPSLLPEIDAAAYVKRHVQTLRKARHEATIEFAYVRIGGRYFYRREVLDAYLRACEVQPSAA